MRADRTHSPSKTGVNALVAHPTILRFAPELRRERHRAGAAARAAHGDEDALLLLLVEVGTIEHHARLLPEQLVQREAARFHLIVVRRRRGLAKGIGRRRGREFRRAFVRTLGHGRDVTTSEPCSPCCRCRRAGSTTCCARWWEAPARRTRRRSRRGAG